MSDNQVSKRIAKRIVSYVGEAGRLINHFSLEDIIKEELATIEAQLRAAETTATAMGLACSEMKQENERLREALSGSTEAIQHALDAMRSLTMGERGKAGQHEWKLVEWLTKRNEALANHFGDANKMVSDGKEGA